MDTHADKQTTAPALPFAQEVLDLEQFGLCVHSHASCNAPHVSQSVLRLKNGDTHLYVCIHTYMYMCGTKMRWNYFDLFQADIMIIWSIVESLSWVQWQHGVSF